jgi:hypothetical protein
MTLKHSRVSNLTILDKKKFFKLLLLQIPMDLQHSPAPTAVLAVVAHPIGNN